MMLKPHLGGIFYLRRTATKELTRRMVIMGGGMAHASLGGVGLGAYFGFSPLLGAAAFCLLSGFGIRRLSRLGGELLTGYTGAASEIGHMVIVENGEECTCGSRGCFEAYSSATALIRDTKRTMAAHPESLLHAIAAEQGGVDGLPGIIKAIRETIIRCGGVVKFGEKVTSLIIDSDAAGNSNTVTGVRTATGYSFDDDIIPATTDICMVGDDIYLAPYFGNVTVMLYNKQLIADAGYAPEDIDTFADLMDIAQKTNAAGRIIRYWKSPAASWSWT